MVWNQERFAITVILGLIQIGRTLSIATYEVQLKDLLKLQKGLGWPSEMLVAEGQEGLMKLTATVKGSQSCMVTTPAGVTFDVSSPPDSRYERWSDDCGLRVRQVTASDTGRWRLTAANSTGSVTGWIEVHVNEDISSYTAPSISLQDGQTQTEVELTSLENAYCLVTQPFSESSLVPGHCRVTLDRTTRAVQGNWKILMGIPGRVSELRVERRVAVESERLDVGYVHDANSNKIHMYCNILHTTKNVTFCRFQKTTNSLGYNVMEGLSDGTHSYYGDGFVAKHCGMTIEKPTDSDFATWRCSVGSQQWVGNMRQEQTPMQALINVMPSHKSVKVKRDVFSETEEHKTVFVQNDLSFTIMCRAEVALSYCWFLHPNGSQFSPVARADQDQQFWYTGQSLQTGDCGITFAHANQGDAGDWVCHMGATNQLGVERTDRVTVRVTGPLAANRKELDVVAGESVTLLCHTANGNRPIDYCRFLTPNYVGINIDSSVTKENAILGRFYFMPGRSLDYGDCSLIISSVEPEDVGTWTCAAMINNDLIESFDTMELHMDFAHHPLPLSRAAIGGMSFGISALFVLLAGVTWYKIGRPVPWRRAQRNSSENVNGLPFDMMSIDSSNSRSSGSTASNLSGSEVDVTFGTLEVGSSPDPPRDPLGVGTTN